MSGRLVVRVVGVAAAGAAASANEANFKVKFTPRSKCFVLQRARSLYFLFIFIFFIRGAVHAPHSVVVVAVVSACQKGRRPSVPLGQHTALGK